MANADHHAPLATAVTVQKMLQTDSKKESKERQKIESPLYHCSSITVGEDAAIKLPLYTAKQKENFQLCKVIL